MTRSIGLEFDDRCQERRPNETLAGLLCMGLFFKIRTAVRQTAVPVRPRAKTKRSRAKTKRSSICQGPDRAMHPLLIAQLLALLAVAQWNAHHCRKIPRKIAAASSLLAERDQPQPIPAPNVVT